MSFYNTEFPQLLVVPDFEGHKGILKVSLNNPEQRNAITYDMIDSFCKVIEYANSDDNVKVILLTGEGKSFCAGGNVKEMKQKQGMFAGEPLELRHRYEQGIQQIPRLLERIEKPIIAAIDGAAVGAGLDLTCMCDIRVCSDKAKFAESFVKIGLVPGVGGSFFLARVMGYAKALEMALTGKMILANEAKELGLVNHVYSQDVYIQEALELGDDIAANSLDALKLTKKAYRQAWGGDITRHLELLAAFQGMAQRTNEHFSRLS